MKPLCTVFLLGLIASVSIGWDNLDYGIPSGSADIIIDREGYAVGFDTNRHHAVWVSYRLTGSEAAGNPNVKRKNDFREDAILPCGSASLSDYRGSGYDRGHLAPAADMAWSDGALSDSFLLSNISPQRPSFNRGIWRELESWVRRQAVKNGSVFVYTGPVFGSSTNRIGVNGVSVPDGYFKVLLSEATNEWPTAIGFVLSNSGSTNSLSAFCVPVSDVEIATGLDFFSALPAVVQSNLEFTVDFDRW